MTKKYCNTDDILEVLIYYKRTRKGILETNIDEVKGFIPNHFRYGIKRKNGEIIDIPVIRINNNDVELKNNMYIAKRTFNRTEPRTVVSIISENYLSNACSEIEVIK